MPSFHQHLIKQSLSTRTRDIYGIELTQLHNCGEYVEKFKTERMENLK